MRKNTAAILIAVVTCLALAMPAAAQANAAQDGMFQGLYQSIVTWFSAYLGGDSPEISPIILPGGDAATGDSPEFGEMIIPGGLRTTGDDPAALPLAPPEGDAATGDSPEIAPIILPGG